MKKPINLYLILLVLFIEITSCFSTNKTATFNQKDILGNWLLSTNQVNYPELIFNADSTAIFKSTGDTLYHFQFRLNSDELILSDFFKNQFNAKILKLDQDSLIFKSLIENKEIQRYVKEKK